MTKQEQLKNAFYNSFREGDLSDEGKANLTKLLALHNPKTNFDKITESAESLAEFIEKLDTFEFIRFSLNKQKFKEWLQQEAQDD